MEVEITKLKKLAGLRNTMRMKSCRNVGRECCMAPFCDYCSSHMKIAPFADVVESYRHRADATLKSHEERMKENPGKDDRVTIEAVVNCTTEMLDELERSHNYEVEVIKEESR